MLKSRPSDDIIAGFNQYLVDFWDCMNSTFDEIEVYINNNSDNPAAELRSTENGGNLFFRPIGLFPFVEAIARILLATNKSFDEIISGYVNLKRNVHSDMWDMILWNPINRRMIMRNQSLVYYLLIKIMDDSILTERENTNMISKYATIFNIELSEARRRIATIRL